MAYALRALGKEVRVVNRDPAQPALLPFPGVADIEIASQVDGDFDAVHRHGVQRPGAHRRRRARAVLHHQHRPPPRQRDVRRDQLVRRRRRGLRRDGVRRHPQPGRAADDGDRHAHLRGDPHRHRVVPLLEHLAAHVRHLPADARGRRRPGLRSRGRVRQQQHRPAPAVRRRPRHAGGRPVGPPRDHLPGPGDGARGGRHLRRHRGAHQPAAHREGDPGRRLLQGVGARRSTA